ncbi:ankyrin repeat domain protein [Nitzschia inconspicua]|uniref:Ankyrin repeat domain protein n=1 Tax=Nitzschia inconspicua TaxID=303405 RepID=A0A9K3PQC5_9STRA|nr:ankyrin repeat domain protein [Nitzschia inconspicua]
MSHHHTSDSRRNATGIGGGGRSRGRIGGANVPSSNPYGSTFNNEDDGSPEGLYTILEQGVTRPEENMISTPEDMKRRRECIEATWDQVRRWLHRHESQQERSAAAYFRGQGDASPLHLICKINNPPTDVVNEIVEAAPETVAWVDNHGWLPLHHACANGASTDVLKILTNAYPEGKTAQDNNSRTPLHFYAFRNSENPIAMAANVGMLCDTGAAAISDHGGMLPIHYACAYGTSPAVLKVLADAYPGSVIAKENKGRTPMHLAMVNSPRDASPGVVAFLLECAGTDAVNVRDKEGNLPLHLLTLGVKSIDATESENVNNVSECLKLYLAAKPYASPDFLAALQDLPGWLLDVAVVDPHVRNILNKKIIQRFPTSILMLDGIMYFALILCFEHATTNFIKQMELEYPPVPDLPESEHDIPNGYFPSLIILFIAATYFFLRELAQVIASLALGAFTSWLYDTTNWLDALVIVLVTYYSAIMTIENPLLQDEGDMNTEFEAFRAGAAVTKGVLWVAVIYFLKNTRVDFAVFLNGVFYVCKRLVAFLLAVLVILILFGQMFWVIYLETPVCPKCNPYNESECALDAGEDCTNDVCEATVLYGNFSHCEVGESFLKVYTMMAGEIGSETRYFGDLSAQIIYVLYGFVVVILLSNVLIAIVTDSYEIVQNDRAAIVFWSNRLDFISEMDGIASVVQRRILCFGKNQTDGSRSVYKQEQASGAVSVESSFYPDGSREWFREAWKSIIGLFDENPYDDGDLRPENIEFWVTILYKALALLIIPLWLLIGFASVGILWPPQVREWLFVQKETVASRSELERKKLEKLRVIQNDMKILKTEIRKEMQNDREAMFRMKAEVDAVQSEFLSDLQQVKELMTTLLDLGAVSN